MYFRRVFAGLDLELRDLSSDAFVPTAARRVFERALEIAVLQRGELHLCAVIDGLDLTSTSASPQQVAIFGDLLAERLDLLAEEAREAGVECEFSLLGGDAGTELVRQADEWSASLIVIGASTHAHPFGPTAWKLLRAAQCPVWIEQAASRTPPPAADDEGDEPAHVLIADDLTPRSADRLMTVIGSYLWREAKCWLLHVVEPERWPEAWQAGVSAAELARRQAARLEAARLTLHEHLSPTDHRTMTYGTLAHVAEGNLADSIRSLVEAWQIDLVICGHGDQSLTFLPYLQCSLLVFPASRPPNPESRTPNPEH
jgi:nucleotide-binding universal stress UspA family protein